MTGILKIITGTPWWVWPLLAFLLWRGINALKPSIIRVHDLFVMPLILATISMRGLIKTYGLPASPLGAWSALFFVGILFVLLTTPRTAILVDRQRGLVQRPGSALTLVIILMVFGVKYYFGYLDAVSPGVTQEMTFVLLRFALSGMMMGMLLSSSSRRRS